MELFGLWRRALGSKIVEGSYDVEHRRIGPYIIPDDAPAGILPDVGNYLMPVSCYYAAMQNINGALAVVQICNDEVGVLTPHSFYLIVKPNVSGGHQELYETILRNPMQVPEYRHIGYIKTWQRSQLVYQYPWYLIQDMSGTVVDYNVTIADNVVVDPPLTLYRELIHSEHEAVYMLTDGTIKFL